MLLTELILSKRGPLAKVWLSAHHERKLSKQQALGVDVGESVEAILTQDDGPTTLRLSGQLMLGVTRIYSRKVQYLLDDCKETRERITLAFRPGVVDLPEDQIRASKNAITFSDVRNDFDFFDWTWAAPPEPISRGLHTAPAAQISLRPNQSQKEFGAYNFGRPAAASIYGGTPSSRNGSIHETESHLDSHDFSGIELGLNLEETFSELGSLEMGRDRVERSGSVASGVRRRDKSVSVGLGGGGDDALLGGDFDQSFGPIDLGLDFDGPLVPDLEHDERQRRDTSALSTPPPVSPPEDMDVTMTEITPRTAARVATLADAHDRTAAAQAAAAAAAGETPRQLTRTKKLRLLTADDELELADEDFAAPNEDSEILGQTNYIPPDNSSLIYQSYFDNPEIHFLPTIKIGNEMMLYAGPEGLAPELEELFTFPQHVLRRNRDVAGNDDLAIGGPATKRARLEVEQQRLGGEDLEEDDEVEAGRRVSVQPSSLDRFGRGTPGGMGDGMDMDFGNPAEDSFAIDFGAAPGGLDDLPQEEFETPRKRQQQRQRETSLAPSRAESIAREIQFANLEDHPLAMFDTRGRNEESQGQSQNQNTPSKSSVAQESVSVARTAGGFSKNTGMAMGLLRREIDAIQEGIREEKVVEFDTIAEKSTKRAASTFFFELLVLGTKDVVKLDQKKGFSGIEVRGKEKLWEEITA